MAIKFKYGGVAFTADTPLEAAETLALFKKQDSEAALKRARSRFFAEMSGGFLQKIDAHLVQEAERSWTPDRFISFIDRLRKPQKVVLAELVSRRQATDEELRNVAGVSGNQALAGVLSGISKQAAALNIPARSIFSFENLRIAGKRQSKYSIADKFLQIATDMNWPPPDV
jgi:hypothetical protein